MKRRHFLAAAAPLPLLGCAPSASDMRHITGGFTGIQVERGHQLRDTTAWPTPTVTHRTHTVIAGGGVAGLAAARALHLRGQDDFALLELEDGAGGNARGGAVGGIACPLGAHYLPLPSDDAPEVQDLLEELGLRQRVAGRWQYDERHLCHSPQERLFFNGTWQDGLLPVQGVGESTLVQYRRFSALVEQARNAAKWTIPIQNRPLAPVKRALAAMTFIAYLEQNGLTDPHLRWYLDYCCRDDYGAGIATVSAWAGIHYFASRHGFHAPGAESAEREGLLTWPEGNAWLTRRLAAPLGERLRTGCVVLRVAQGRHGVEVDAFNTATQQVERWQAQQAIVALPIFVAARVVEGAPDFLRQAAQRVVYAPWLVANIHIREPLRDRPGPAPSWDNVIYTEAGGGLGYVDAMHQSLHPVPGATVLTHYRALGDVAGGPSAGRKQLLEQPWTHWRDTILAELATAHPDLPAKATRMELTRYGHAMAIPVPSVAGQIGFQPSSDVRKQLSKKEQFTLAQGRLRFAHSDWAGYSIFEEAFTLGHVAGQA
ncbi:FAD-dependent oxidoreductase [Rhodoferax saidenbachensis]|uniref:NAD/FAD-dependent oxidoreductase n=1 Tax=Rhodoferax saidenbachensis TaxID=1484693 RepID=A0ABU1ZP44_9BURK|nr:FAD-dependent oxidoreductase [Rhodoferax saidenbachensis]MDR7307326.1 putative NAD/FAD-dependent oxidoreductase [Rhodoferax saidenbachensis]